MRHSLQVSNPPRAYLDLSNKQKKKIRLIKGHHPFGLHEHAPVPYTYVTILRDPVRRMASMHRMMKKEWPGYNVAEMSLPEFVHYEHTASRPNAQTVQVAGVSDAEAADAPEATLDRAKAHIDDHFTVAGVTERFDETLVMMKERLDWPRMPYYVTSRVGKKATASGQSPARRESLPDDVRDLIASENDLDVQPYAYVQARFDKEVKEEGESFQNTVQAFQESNRRIAPLIAPPLKAFRKVRHAIRKLLA